MHEHNQTLKLHGSSTENETSLQPCDCLQNPYLLLENYKVEGRERAREQLYRRKERQNHSMKLEQMIPKKNNPELAPALANHSEKKENKEKTGQAVKHNIQSLQG